MTYYHATPKRNVFAIMREGIKPSPLEECVYLCDTEQGALQFMVVKRALGITEYAVIPVELEEDTVEPSTDHDPRYFNGAKAFIHKGAIPSELVPSELDKIKLYVLEEREDTEQ